MKRAIIIAITTAFVILSSFQVFSEEIELKEKREKEWEMYDQEGNFVGTVKRIKKRRKTPHFRYYNKEGKYMGSIFDSGTLRPKGAGTHSTRITPEEARFDLDVWTAIKKQ